MFFIYKLLKFLIVADQVDRAIKRRNKDKEEKV